MIAFAGFDRRVSVIKVWDIPPFKLTQWLHLRGSIAVCQRPRLKIAASQVGSLLMHGAWRMCFLGGSFQLLCAKAWNIDLWDGACRVYFLCDRALYDATDLIMKCWFLFLICSMTREGTDVCTTQTTCEWRDRLLHDATDLVHSSAHHTNNHVNTLVGSWMLAWSDRPFYEVTDLDRSLLMRSVTSWSISVTACLYYSNMFAATERDPTNDRTHTSYDDMNPRFLSSGVVIKVWYLPPFKLTQWLHLRGSIAVCHHQSLIYSAF